MLRAFPDVAVCVFPESSGVGYRLSKKGFSESHCWTAKCGPRPDPGPFATPLAPFGASALRLVLPFSFYLMTVYWLPGLCSLKTLVPASQPSFPLNSLILHGSISTSQPIKHLGFHLWSLVHFGLSPIVTLWVLSSAEVASAPELLIQVETAVLLL